jgi:excisionase family DNA binding protein
MKSFLTVVEVARPLRISTAAVRRLTRDGSIPSLRVGKKILIRKTGPENFLRR